MPLLRCWSMEKRPRRQEFPDHAKSASISYLPGVFCFIFFFFFVCKFFVSFGYFFTDDRVLWMEEKYQLLTTLTRYKLTFSPQNASTDQFDLLPVVFNYFISITRKMLRFLLFCSTNSIYFDGIFIFIWILTYFDWHFKLEISFVNEESKIENKLVIKNELTREIGVVSKEKLIK